MPPAADEPRWTRATDVLWRDLPDGVLLLPAGSDEPLAVLGPAAACWDHLASPRTLPELTAAVGPDDEGARRQARKDLADLLDHLRSVGAVSRTGAP